MVPVPSLRVSVNSASMSRQPSFALLYRLPISKLTTIIIKMLQLKASYEAPGARQLDLNNMQISFCNFSSLFKLIRSEKDLHLGSFMLMKHTVTKRRVIVKNHQYQSQEELSLILSDYSNLCRVYGQSEFLCEFLGFCLTKNAGANSIYLIYDYHQATLKEEMESMQAKNECLSQKELQTLMDCCLASLTTLQKFQLNFMCLKQSNILIENKNSIDLKFRLLFTPYLSGAVSEIKQNNSDIQGYNLADRQLQLLNQNKENSNQMGLGFLQRIKADKQSLGLMLLRIATSMPGPSFVKHRIYNVNKKFELTWDPEGLKARFDALSTNYSKNFVKKIEFLLFQKGFCSFERMPDFFKKITSVHQSANRHNSKLFQNSSVERSNSWSRNKSPKNRSTSNRKYLNISDSNISKKSKDSILSNSSAKKRPMQEFFSMHNSDVKEFSAVHLSPSKMKSSRYEELKKQIEDKIISKIDKSSLAARQTEDGSNYYGMVRENRKQGWGIVYFRDGDIYGGEWVADEMQGTGFYLFKNCDFYTGDIRNGMKHGRGKYVYHMGNTYEGEWQNDRKNGYGSLFNSERTEGYEGKWLDGIKEGEGIYRWRNGDVFEGCFVKGLKSGKGTVTKKDGTRISGQWYNDVLRGMASIKFRSGTVYNGEVRVEGNQFLLEGKGNEISMHGTVYEGQFAQGKRTGPCKIQYANKDTYQGQMLDDKFEGEGTYYYYHARCYYRGHWKAGLQQGDGTLLFENGTYIRAQWSQGLMAKTGKIVYSNGHTYEGELGNYGPNGRGVYTCGSKGAIEGAFKKGVPVYNL